MNFKTKFIYPLFTTVFFLVSNIIFAQSKMNWEELPQLPVGASATTQAGLAGAFVGTSNGAMLVGGGANFSNQPLVEGGKKVWHDDLFVLLKGEDGSYQWQDSVKMPNGPLAYGKAISTTKGIVCIGGSTGEETVKTVFMMSWNVAEQKVVFTTLPNIPVTIENMGATAVGDKIYVACGKQDGKSSNALFMLNLGAEKPVWKQFKSLPGPARLQPVMCSQEGGANGNIFVFGGYDVIDGLSTVYTDGYVFNGKIWKKIADVKPKDGKNISVFGAASIKIGTHHILVFGGYNKTVFEEWFKLYNSLNIPGKENELAKTKREFFGQTPKSFKWNSKVLAYHTVTNTWMVVGDYPYPANCGAGIAKFAEKVVIVNGEIMPGVRTPKIFAGEFVQKNSFGTTNWIVLITYLTGMLGLGFFFMLRERGTDDFFKGGGRIPWWAAGVSIFATMLSSISFMAIPGMTYAGTWGIFLLAVTITLSQPVVIKYYLPFFRRLNVTTAYEYLEARFNVQCRTVASLVFVLFMIVRIGIVSYLPALALQAVTGIDIVTCIFGIGLITIIYCTMGGIEAVIWGDFIQGIVLIVGAIIAFMYITSGIDGGVGGIIDIGIKQAKFEIIDFAFSIKRPTIWILLIGGFLSNLFTYTSDQSVIQRYITVKDEKSAVKSIWVNAIACIPVSILFYAIGTGLFAYYQTSPELLDVSMSKGDQIFPYFIMQKLPVGLAGLLIAAVFSATMSTLSSNINSAATAITTDFYQRFRKGVSDRQSMRVARLSTVIVGGIGIFIAYALYLMKDLPIFEYFNMIVGLLVSGLGVFFVMGIFTKKITGWGALIGFTVSSISLYFIKKSSMHWSGYSIAVLIICMVVAYIASLILGDKKDIDGLTIYTLKNSSEDK